MIIWGAEILSNRMKAAQTMFDISPMVENDSKMANLPHIFGCYFSAAITCDKPEILKLNKLNRIFRETPGLCFCKKDFLEFSYVFVGKDQKQFENLLREYATHHFSRG